ncbi:hypothetical protein CBR_g36305 [Chara braunii]|uniref:FHA domain-containing protein n=1 Tax=Chara braunii TaxID=69332 RepID=A0A388LKL2_CHABU|nr:hypothetical protein CBR_g36305 [Chara braunii]|eukprot:GBG82775.1 hypothetical protein CBR_g36305 [Chara braunii]
MVRLDCSQSMAMADLHCLSSVARMLHVAGGRTCEVFHVVPGKVYTIGRSKTSCDLVFEDRRVSRRHCQIKLNETGYKLLLRDGYDLDNERSTTPSAHVPCGKSMLKERGKIPSVPISSLSCNGVYIDGTKVVSGVWAEVQDGAEVSLVACTRDGKPIDGAFGEPIGFRIDVQKDRHDPRRGSGGGGDDGGGSGPVPRAHSIYTNDSNRNDSDNNHGQTHGNEQDADKVSEGRESCRRIDCDDGDGGGNEYCGLVEVQKGSMVEEGAGWSGGVKQEGEGEACRTRSRGRESAGGGGGGQGGGTAGGVASYGKEAEDSGHEGVGKLAGGHSSTEAARAKGDGGEERRGDARVNACNKYKDSEDGGERGVGGDQVKREEDTCVEVALAEDGRENRVGREGGEGKGEGEEEEGPGEAGTCGTQAHGEGGVGEEGGARGRTGAVSDREAEGRGGRDGERGTLGRGVKGGGEGKETGRVGEVERAGKCIYHKAAEVYGNSMLKGAGGRYAGRSASVGADLGQGPGGNKCRRGVERVGGGGCKVEGGKGEEEETCSAGVGAEGGGKKGQGRSGDGDGSVDQREGLRKGSSWEWAIQSSLPKKLELRVSRKRKLDDQVAMGLGEQERAPCSCSNDVQGALAGNNCLAVLTAGAHWRGSCAGAVEHTNAGFSQGKYIHVIEVGSGGYDAHQHGSDDSTWTKSEVQLWRKKMRLMDAESSEEWIGSDAWRWCQQEELWYVGEGANREKEVEEREEEKEEAEVEEKGKDSQRDGDEEEHAVWELKLSASSVEAEPEGQLVTWLPTGSVCARGEEAPSSPKKKVGDGGESHRICDDENNGDDDGVGGPNGGSSSIVAMPGGVYPIMGGHAGPPSLSHCPLELHLSGSLEECLGDHNNIVFSGGGKGFGKPYNLDRSKTVVFTRELVFCHEPGRSNLVEECGDGGGLVGGGVNVGCEGDEACICVAARPAAGDKKSGYGNESRQGNFVHCREDVCAANCPIMESVGKSSSASEVFGLTRSTGPDGCGGREKENEGNPGDRGEEPGLLVIEQDGNGKARCQQRSRDDRQRSQHNATFWVGPQPHAGRIIMGASRAGEVSRDDGVSSKREHGVLSSSFAGKEGAYSAVPSGTRSSSPAVACVAERDRGGRGERTQLSGAGCKIPDANLGGEKRTGMGSSSIINKDAALAGKEEDEEASASDPQQNCAESDEVARRACEGEEERGGEGGGAEHESEAHSMGSSDEGAALAGKAEGEEPSASDPRQNCADELERRACEGEEERGREGGGAKHQSEAHSSHGESLLDEWGRNGRLCLNFLDCLEPGSKGNEGCVSLDDLLSPVSDLKAIFAATFTLDFWWFLTAHGIPPSVPVTIACHHREHGWSHAVEDRWERPEPSIWPNLVLVYPVFPDVNRWKSSKDGSGMGCHHPKLFIIERRNHVRVIVTSANLNSRQWQQVTNTVWWQDFRRRPEPDLLSIFPSSFTAFGRSGSTCSMVNDFSAELAAFVSSLVADVPSESHWVLDLIHYDFSAAGGWLLASAPGLHSPHCPPFPLVKAPPAAKQVKDCQGTDQGMMLTVRGKYVCRALHKGEAVAAASVRTAKCGAIAAEDTVPDNVDGCSVEAEGRGGMQMQGSPLAECSAAVNSGCGVVQAQAQAQAQAQNLSHLSFSSPLWMDTLEENRDIVNLGCIEACLVGLHHRFSDAADPTGLRLRSLMECSGGSVFSRNCGKHPRSSQTELAGASYAGHGLVNVRLCRMRGVAADENAVGVVIPAKPNVRTQGTKRPEFMTGESRLRFLLASKNDPGFGRREQEQDEGVSTGEQGGIMLGFLPRATAQWVAPLWDAGVCRFSASLPSKDLLEAAAAHGEGLVRLWLYPFRGPAFCKLGKKANDGDADALVPALVKLLVAIKRPLGLWRLQHILAQHRWPDEAETDFDFGSSSVGTSLDAAFLGAFSAAAGRRSLYVSSDEESDPEWGCWTAKHEAKNPSVKIVFPTIERVIAGKMGASPSSGLLCFAESTWSRLKSSGIFHDAVPHPAERAGIPMHIKVGRRRFQTSPCSQAFGWMYCGSHNFSPAAWGRPVGTGPLSSPGGWYGPLSAAGSIMGPVGLHIHNYEFGIIFIEPPPTHSVKWLGLKGGSVSHRTRCQRAGWRMVGGRKYRIQPNRMELKIRKCPEYAAAAAAADDDDDDDDDVLHNDGSREDNRNSTMLAGCKDTGLDRFVVPFRIPPPPYTSEDEPATQKKLRMAVIAEREEAMLRMVTTCANPSDAAKPGVAFAGDLISSDDESPSEMCEEPDEEELLAEGGGRAVHSEEDVRVEMMALTQKEDDEYAATLWTQLADEG